MLKQFVHLLDRTQSFFDMPVPTLLWTAAYAVGLKKALKNDLSCQDVVKNQLIIFRLNLL